MWEITTNIVEYTQSKDLLLNAFNLLDILNQYSTKQKYEEIIESSIELCKSIGTLSVGIYYAVNGYTSLNFKFGIERSIKQLKDLKGCLVESKFKNNRISQLNHDIDNSIYKIENERERLKRFA